MVGTVSRLVSTDRGGGFTGGADLDALISRRNPLARWQNGSVSSAAQHDLAAGREPEKSTPAVEATTQGAGVGQLDAMLASGAPDPARVADLVRKYPQERYELMTRLHQTVGSQYVQQVAQLLHTGESQKSLSGPESLLEAQARVHDNAPLLDHATMLGDAAQRQLEGLSTGLLPAYRAARDALDSSSMFEAGVSVVGVFQVVHSATAAMRRNLNSVKRSSSPSTDLASEEAELGRIDALEARHQFLSAQWHPAAVAATITMTPTVFRGSQVAGSPVIAFPPNVAAEAGTEHDALAAQLENQLREEISRTVLLLKLVDKQTREFAAPGALGDRSKLADARMDLRTIAHRPIDLAFVSAVLASKGLWDYIDGSSDPSSTVCTEGGMLADASKRAKQTGWLTDTGAFDADMARLSIQAGDSESVLGVYSMIMSAPESGRAALL
jgi:hypothetical protein